MNKIYSKRVVCCIEVLSEFNVSNKNDYLESIKNMLIKLNDYKIEEGYNLLSLKEIGREIIINDNKISILYSIFKGISFYYIINDLINIQLYLLSNNILITGIIKVDKDNKSINKEILNNPVIYTSLKTIQHCLNHELKVNSFNKFNINSILQHLRCTDYPDIFYIDFLSNKHSFNTNEDYECLISKINQNISDLSNSNYPYIIEKYKWLKNNLIEN